MSGIENPLLHYWDKFLGGRTRGKQTCERGERGGGSTGGAEGAEGRQDNQRCTKVPYAQAELPYRTSIPPRFFYSKALMENF